MNLIDIALIVMILLSALFAAKRGFLLSLLNLGAVVLAGFLSRFLSKPVSEFLYQSFLHEKVMDRLYEVLPAGSVSGQLFTGVESVLSELPKPIIAIAKQFGLYPDVTGGTQVLTVEGIEEDYIIPLITGIIAIAATVILFILFNIIFKMAALAINRSVTDRDSHKFIHKSNALLGFLVGLVKAFIPLGICCILMNLLAPFINNPTFTDLVDTSAFCRLFAGIFG